MIYTREIYIARIVVRIIYTAKILDDVNLAILFKFKFSSKISNHIFNGALTVH